MRWIKKSLQEIRVGDILRVDPNPNKEVDDGVLGRDEYRNKVAVIFKVESNFRYWFRVQNSTSYWHGDNPKRYVFLDRSTQ